MTEALQQEIRTLRSLFNSDRDPDGRVFAPLADAYRRSGQLQEAVRLLNDGLTRLPDFVPGHVVAAQLYVEQGLAEEAEIAAKSALKLDSENVNALRSLLRVLEERGDEPGADEVRSRLISLEPDFTADGGPEGAGSADMEPEALEDGSLVDWEGASTATVGAVAEAVPLEEASDSEIETLEMPALAPEPEVPELIDVAAEPGGDVEVALSFDEEPRGPDALADEAVFRLDALAPAEPEAASGDVIDLAALAPDTEGDEEDAVSLDALAPDVERGLGEPVFDLDALAPAVADEEVVDLDALAPGGSGDADVVSLEALAPDVEQGTEEPVFDLDALAPEPEIEVEEAVLEMSALAPAPEPEVEEPVLEMSALAPEPEPEVEEPVLEMSALAPEPEPEVEEPVLEMSALAPEPEPEVEEPVLEMSALAPEPEVEEPVLEMDALAPTDEEPVIDLDALAPEPEPTAGELVIDLDTLAPEPEPSTDEPTIQAEPADEPVIDLDALAASAVPDDAPDGEAASEEPEPEREPEPAEPAASETDDAPSSDEKPGEPFYTRTLASLYETQGAVSEALRVLRRLHAADPDDQDLARRIAELEDRLESMDGGEPRVEGEEEEEEEVETLARDLAQSGEGEHDVDSPFAWAEHEAEEEQPTGPTMSDYFEDLLSWEPDEES